MNAPKEAVDHPSHYNTGAIEVIAAIDDWKLNFCLGNVVKYVARADHKNNAIEDLKKARWYLDHEIQQREANIVAKRQADALAIVGQFRNDNQ